MTDARNRGPLPPAVSVKGTAQALLRTALDKAPVLGTITRYIDNLEQQRNSERKAEWTKHICDADDEDTFAARIQEGLEGPEAELIRSALYESIRAAMDAVDEALVAPIARLTSRYLNHGVPDRWTFRDVLDLLRTLDREMLEVLRNAVRELRSAVNNHGETFSTETDTEVDGTFTWSAELLKIGGQTLIEERKVLLGRGAPAYRLVVALNGAAARGMFSGQTRLNPPPFTPAALETLAPILF